MLLSTWLVAFSIFPLTVSAGGTMVVPSLSGNFSTSDLLPRVHVPSARTGCPWDAAGLVNFPFPTGDDVTLEVNTNYLLSTTVVIPGTLTVPAGSSLVFADTTFNVTATSILVEDGALRIGASTCRTSPTTQHTVTLTGARSDPDAHAVGHKGIVVNGTRGRIEIFGHLYQPSWTRLAATVAASATELYLQECVDWPVHSKILVTTTHRIDWRRHNQNEEVSVAGVSCETIDYLEDGVSSHNFAKITLSQPVAHSHYAGRHEYQAEVALLSRNVLIQGDAANSAPKDPQDEATVCGGNIFSEVPCQGYYLTGYGGHLIVMDFATARLSAAEFYRMGQTNELGRYPVHFHLLGQTGNASFVSDCSVHESYYRAYVVHGTSHMLVTRNVAYDVIGHTYYMEAGNEELNEVSYNLGAHVHPIGHFLNFQGQEQETKFTREDLGGGVTPPDGAFSGAIIPADGAASPFYISNMYNNFTGNAAVGGFSGFAMVSFPRVIGEWPADATPDSTFVPMNRPNLPNGFYGNSARSVGWFWNMGPAFYVGGFLATSDWPDGDQGELEYIPGRFLGGRRKPTLDNGDDAWLTFVNIKAALANVGAGDWNLRSKWYNMDVIDLGERSFNAFGRVVFRNINVRCRTTNGLTMVPWPVLPKLTEKMWYKNQFKMFRAYDTGQRHVLDAWQISGCGSAEEPVDPILQRAQIWSIPHGVNVNQNQVALRNITYLDGPPDPAKLISIDVGKKDTYSAYYGTFFDTDGSTTQRRPTTRRSDGQLCRPTIVGSAGVTRAITGSDGKLAWEQRPVNFWYKLSGLDDGGSRGSNVSDARCDLLDQAEYPMWACDEGSMNVGALLMTPNGRAQTTARTYEVWGGLTHFGDTMEAGVPMSGDIQLVGPHDHAHRGGWFVQYYMSADDPSTWSSPKTLDISKVGIREGTVLIMALAYPPDTTFDMTRKTYRNDPGTSFSAAASLAGLRTDTTGLVYFFDGTYLYLKAHRLDVDPLGFGENGMYIPDDIGGWAEWTVTATWGAGSGCAESDEWCRAATKDPPPASVGEISGRSPVYPCTTATVDWRIRSVASSGAGGGGEAASKWDPNARFTAQACNETRKWTDLYSLLDTGGAETGGLGRLMVAGAEEVWVCIRGHPCPAAAGLPADAGMCFVYHEGQQRFLPWGTMDELQLF